MNIQAIAKSYWRSIQRGTRTMEDVPDDMQEAVRALGQPAGGEAVK